jgi:hypothetical protein
VSDDHARAYPGQGGDHGVAVARGVGSGELEIRFRDGSRTRNATRYLCVGAYVDRSFRENVVRNVLGKQLRAVAPSYSIDVVPIIRHCLDARRRVVVRDGIVTAILVVAFAVSFWQLLGLLLFVQSLRIGWRALNDLNGNIQGFVRNGALSFLLFILSSLTGLTALTSVMSGIEVGGLGGAEQSVVISTARVFLSVLIGVVGTFVVLLVHRLQVHDLVLSQLTDERFAPERAPIEPAKYRDRLEYLGAAQAGNVTVYARAAEARPFIGSGLIDWEESWSMALPLIPDKSASDKQAAPLTIAALYDQMRRALVSVSDPTRPESQRIAGLSLQDRLFAVGLLPPRHELLEEGTRPRFRVSRDQMLRLADQERNIATHYLTVRISGWNGELEVTIFLYFSIRGGMLYVEFLSAVLPPIRDAYHGVDSYERITGRVLLRNVAGALLETPGALVNSPVNILTPVIEAVWRQFDVRSQLQEISNRVAYDFGAVGSVREYGAEWSRANMLHDLDAGRHIRVISRRVLDAIGEVLEEFGFSTEEFDQRRMTIINDHSYRLSTGDIYGSTIAAGPHATAKSTAGGRSTSAPERGKSAGRRADSR